MASDRILGLVAICVALAFIGSAIRLQVGFFPDPVGSRTFPIVIGGVIILCSLVMIFRPDEQPDWPGIKTWGALGAALVVLVVYAFLLKPLGFIIPTALAAGILSYQIHPKALHATLAGVGLSIGLFAVFRYALELGLVAFP